MNKKFTLTELIIAVIVISLLATIVIVKVLDMKNKSIGVAVANNTKIIQTAVDRFALDNNGEYPIKNDLTVNLSNPQLIDVAKLKKEGYLKKELETSKIKNQYYWLDVFGIGWGATEKTVENLTSVSDKDGKTYLEFITPTGATSYRVYEVVGYNGSGEVSNKKNRHYKFITEVDLKKKRQKVNFEIPDSSKTYLISAVDQYDQETAPVGVFYKGPAGFKPIISGEGSYEFELESIDEMFWIKYVAIQDTPGDSTINYRFKVKDENGLYGEWTNDFNSLESSKGIFVEVNMKGDADGNKPSLYDFRIVYRYEYEENFPLPQTVVTKPNDNMSACPTPDVVSTYVDGKWLEGQPKLFTYLVKLPKDKYINSIETPSLYGYSIVNVKYQYADQTGNYVFATGSYDIPSGSCVHLIYEMEQVKQTGSAIPSIGGGTGNGNGSETGNGTGIGTGGETKFFSPPIVKVCENKCLEVCVDCTPPCLENCVNHCEKQNCTEDEWCQRNECIEPPTCKEGDSNCTPPVCVDNCFAGGPPTAPNPKDMELQDSDWVTVDTLKFFAHGPDNIPTRWYKMIADDEQDGVSTRILYRFAASNGYYWSSEYEEIIEVGQSQSLLVAAYLQIHKDVKDNPSLQPPVVNSIKVLHERGEVNLDLLKPTLTILPKKNNNEGRDVFSDASVFDWGHMAFDPKGKKLSEPEWIGKETTYPIGIHTIKARVKNDTDMWSNWTSYTFEVLPEKPIAKITKNTPMVLKDKKIEWSAAQSYDPDGDVIVNTEWRGDKLNNYDKEGTYTVGLRVQDSEGNWSDWTEETIKVTDSGVIVYRIEGEDSDISKVNAPFGLGGSNNVITGTSYSNGQARTQYGGYVFEPTSTVISFKGIGFDLNVISASGAVILLDGVQIDSVTGSKIVSQTGLENTNHKIIITTTGKSNYATIDYVDIYDTSDKPSISNIYSRKIDSSGKEDIMNSNSIVSSLGQQMKVYYKLQKDAYVTVKIYDKNKNVIKTIVTKEKKSGGSFNTHSVIWDGSSESGEDLYSGTYTLEIYALGIAEKESGMDSYSILLDNEKPTKSYEAESSYFPKKAGNGGAARVVAYDGARGNEAFHMQGGFTSDKTVTTVQFSGTGFDLKTIDGVGGSIFLDNEAPVTIKGNYTYSRRELTNGVHTLRIETLSKSQSLYIDYLDVYEENDRPSLVNHYSRILQGTKENMINNNKFSPRLNQSLKLSYAVDRNAITTINVVDKEKKLVKNLVSNQRVLSTPTGGYSTIWDGTDRNKEVSKTDTYFFEVITEGVRGTINTYYYEIGLDNTLPAIRLEGESTAFSKNPGIRGATAKSVAYEGASGEKVFYMAGAYTSESTTSIVTFTGTGFDLNIISGTIGTIVVDTGPSVSVSAPYFYSVRDLNYGTHTIKITTNSNAQNLYIDYLDVYR